MRTILPNILPSRRRLITVHDFSDRNGASASYLSNCLESTIVGLSITLDADGALDAIALATTTEVCVIETRGIRNSATAFLHNVSVRKVLDGTSHTLSAFDMGAAALHIYRAVGCAVSGVDLSTLLAPSDFASMCPSQALAKALEVPAPREVDRLWEAEDRDSLALRAWVSAM
jgi:hypothetical protein